MTNHFQKRDTKPVLTEKTPWNTRNTKLGKLMDYNNNNNVFYLWDYTISF